MKYEIVALFDNNSTNYLKTINYSLHKKLRLSRYSPNFYIEIISASNVNFDILNKILSNILNPYKNFKVKVDNNIYINTHNKKINLKILNKGYLSKITRNIGDTLSLYGFKLNKTYENSDFYVTMFDLNRKNSYHLNKLDNISLIKNTLKVNKIEVWALNNNKQFLVKSYHLREY